MICCLKNNAYSLSGCYVMFYSNRLFFQVALSTVLEKKSQEVVLENVSESSWVKLNPGTVSYSTK